MKISINVKFILKNIDTNETKKYLVQRYTIISKPIYTGRKKRIGVTYEPTSDGGDILDDGTMIITDSTTIGKAVLNKQRGDKILVQKPRKDYEPQSSKNKVLQYVVLAVGEKEISDYENGIPFSEQIKQQIRKYIKPQVLKQVMLFTSLNWTRDYCFAIEKLSVIDNKTYLIGSTFKRGNLHHSNVMYKIDTNFVEYTGEFKDAIIEKMPNHNSHQNKIVSNKSHINKIDLEKQLNNGLSYEQIIHKFLAQVIGENRAKLVEIKEIMHLPAPTITLYAFLNCTQFEIEKLISFPKEYVSYTTSYQEIKGFRSKKKFQIYNIEYHEYAENDFFQNEIKFTVIKKTYTNRFYSDYALKVMIAEDNLNDAKHALDSLDDCRIY